MKWLLIVPLCAILAACGTPTEPECEVVNELVVAVNGDTVKVIPVCQ